MKFFLTLSFLASFLFAIQTDSHATHVTGGGIEYTCHNNDTFLVQLKLLRDCSGIAAPSNVVLEFNDTCGTTFTQTLLPYGDAVEITMSCSSGVTTTCNGGSIFGVQEILYQGLVVLNPNCASWTMSWQSCCRASSNNLTNGTSSNLYLEATVDLSASNCNNSPKFSMPEIPTVCQFQPVSHNFGAYDIDGDSLSFSLIPAMTGPYTSVVYNPLYSGILPLGGNTPVSIDSTNGIISFTPTYVGVYLIAVRVDEFDPITGAHKGYVIRDCQVVVNYCGNQFPYSDSVGIVNFNGDGNLLSNNKIEACVGDDLSFDMVFYDNDTIDSLTIISNLQELLDTSVVLTLSGSNPLTVHVDYTVTKNVGLYLGTIRAMDNSCPFRGFTDGSFLLKVKSSVYAGPDQAICAGTQAAHINSIANNNILWSVISGDSIVIGTNFSCDTCANVIVSPTNTTTYLLQSSISSNCQNSDTITISVVPDFDIYLQDDTLICQGTPTQLSVSTNQPGLTYNYNWTPTQNITGQNTYQPIVSPVSSTNYNVEVTSAAGCQKNAEISVLVASPFPTGNYILGDTVLCVGDSANLSVQLGTVNYGTCGLSQNSCNGNSGFATVGNGVQTNTVSGYPAIFSGSVQSSRNQMLYYAYELNALGLTGSSQINSIAIDLASVGIDTNFLNFNVKIGCTSTSNLTSTFESGLTTVYSTSLIPITVGWNEIVFSTPYVWDGTSNLIVEFCFENSGSNPNSNAQQRFTSTVQQTVIYSYSGSSGVCGTTNGTLSNSRPNLKFGYCTGINVNNLNFSWSPSSSLTSSASQNTIATPINSTTYQVIVSDSQGVCADTLLHSINVSPIPDPSFSFPSTICESDSIIQLFPVTSGGIWTGSGITDPLSGFISPTTLGAGNYQINYALGGLCGVDTTLTVPVLSVPNADIIAVDQLCSDYGIYTPSTVTSGGVFYSNSIPIDSVSGSFDPSLLMPGLYTYFYEINQACSNSDFHQVEIVDSIPILVSNVELCDNEQIQLDSTVQVGANFLSSVFYTFQGGGVLDNSTGLFSGAGLLGSNYVELIATDSNGNCSSSQTIPVQVNATDYVQLVIDSFHTGQQVETLSANLPLNNASYTNTSLNTGTNPITVDSLHQFSPNQYMPGAWEFDFIYTNAEGCVGQSKDTLYITVSVGLEDFLNCKMDVSLFPVPVDDVLNVKLTGETNSEINISVYDISGKLMYLKNSIEVPENALQTIDVSQWPTGIYVFELITDNHKTTEKFIKR